jgi:hypothetical protein
MPKERPLYDVFLVPKEPAPEGKKRHWTKVASVWQNFPDGTSSMTMEPGFVLDWRLQKDFHISLKPVKE